MYPFIKRLFDIILGLLGLILMFALSLIVLVPVLLTDRGRLFYNAQRVGKGGKSFKMFKFRTMVANAPDLLEPDGSTYNAADDPRLTPVGRFLRKTSLDELPQVLNVLAGQMSIIGPRPDLQREVDLYEAGDEAKLLVKPGITGYAQVYGRNAIPWRQRLKLDAYYVEHCGLWLDTKIFMRSFLVVIRGEGVYNQKP